ncbi:MAG: 5-formyltetrahydrofolate cyclo-ligase [Verrucomicrobiota bacterium]
MTEPRDAKAQLREQIRTRMKSLTPAARRSGGAELCARLRAQRVWQESNAVLLFAPLPDEPDVWPLLTEALAAHKQVALPSFIATTNNYIARRVTNPARDLVIGKFGIREVAELSPEMELNQLDLVLAPGVAFDLHGRRLGRGKGFYDRLLAAVRGTKCGVAFDEQLVDAVPVGPLDIPLNCILTPTRWIET